MVSQGIQGVKMKLNIYEAYFFLVHSAKEFVKGTLGSIWSLRKPKNLYTILVGGLLLAIFTKRYGLIKWIVPPIIIVYLIGQKINGKYKHALKINALKKGNDTILNPLYEKYTSQPDWKRKDDLNYEEWKKEELNKARYNQYKEDCIHNGKEPKQYKNWKELWKGKRASLSNYPN